MNKFSDVYDFWIGDGKVKMDLWFKKDPVVDKKIRDKFGPWLDSFEMVDYEEWKTTPKGLVSLIILLDQFPRNAFRDTKRMFAFDQEALDTTREGLDRGMHDQLSLCENLFLTLPLEHSEDITDQKECVRLFQDMYDNAKADQKEFAAQILDYAKKHMAIIEKFGRFPHRNFVLGRSSSPEELAFLKTPGSSF